MRIPSQFDDDNLYRKKIPRGESVKTFRKLIRLALGLALVVVDGPGAVGVIPPGKAQ